MIRSVIDIQQILSGLESILCVDYAKVSIFDIADNAKECIEAKLQLQITDTLYHLQETVPLRDNIDEFLSQVVFELKTLAMLNSLVRYDRDIKDTLADVKFLGFNKHELELALKSLQDEDLYKNRETFMQSLIAAASNIPAASVNKRLLTCLYILDRLGIFEGVAIIAEYLYMGVILC